VTYEKDKRFGQAPYGLVADEAHYKAELFQNGPFELTLMIYEDFPNYKSGVYQHVTGKNLGPHSVKMLGWGVDNGTPYWLIANSFNPDWGDKGTFKILRGSNECGVESDAVAGLPKL